MVKVSRRDNEPLDKMLRRFNKRCEKEGLIKDIKKSQFYEKPSERKRRVQMRIRKEIEKNIEED